ncbi:2-oxoglutarate ferredoxin oxidoreductase subunit beta [Parafrankia irregularis]|uniref:2-oxoglutarate ferredoxin oxidoreductase subunit beta n=1 Tax=Parafrankia irregularis TaxID=795642 RepID=A0A0S4QID9_9ACTN|nr:MULTISPECIES: 2-oxoacid:ferredoxin oxidoreductase subunit beta [Parafrankia]MBE3203878.1 2-oxoacid:ferredoxin oxidoreductase subunit beta [Parafrankia sp. CH37]CUU55251.1 2-oxoglutarate ferredoxin oxidoreductase subunit beta [Parafrankia irregularis]
MTSPDAVGKQLTAKDFSAGEARWCPGCGDHAILNNMRNLMPTLGIPRENFVVISGIGCSSRLPYYLDTYGMHSIHGRAPSIATGVSINRPDLSVWVVTGDGDALSIGGNHLIHALRRNVNLKILLFNNQIYGLTKGQFSPATKPGTITPSSPFGSLDHSFNPLALALGAEASFVARTVDTDRKHMMEILAAAAAHDGSALVEIRQNCPTFNHGERAVTADTSVPTPADGPIRLEAGSPILFGADSQWAVLRDAETGDLKLGRSTEKGVVVHNPRSTSPTYAYALARIADTEPELAPIGVYRAVERASFDKQYQDRLADARAGGRGDLQDLLTGNDSWTVPARS